MKIYHYSVLKNEVINFWINPKVLEKSQIILVDATCGEGGHSLAILEKAKKDNWLNKLKLICMDQDEEILNKAKVRLQKFKKNIIFINVNFINLEDELAKLNIKKIDGILFDLGISNYHYKKSNRGFSFINNELLDMRINLKQDLTAGRIVNQWGGKELKEIFKTYGEERFSPRITKFIIERRKVKPIKTSIELAEIIKKAIPRKFWPKHIHPATKVFQALRIAVNNELENLSLVLEKATNLLNQNGRILVISFHSLEDRIVKNIFKEKSATEKDLIYGSDISEPLIKILNRKPIISRKKEKNENPASRSAKLRVAEKN